MINMMIATIMVIMKITMIHEGDKNRGYFKGGKTWPWSGGHIWGPWADSLLGEKYIFFMTITKNNL